MNLQNDIRTKLKDQKILIESALIGGQWISAKDSDFIEVTNPADGTVIGTVPNCGREETSAAINAAQLAFQDWRKTTAATRSRILERWHDLMLTHVNDLATILTIEQGKPLAEAQGEIRYAASFVKWFAEEGRRINGYTVPAATSDRRIMVLKEPVGVCAAITPWNFPAAMITRKCAPGLAAGCTFVVKPSELTPFTALALAELAIRAGLPAGVLNIITGLPSNIGETLTASPIVRKLSFTGSTRIGSLLMQQSAPTLKRLSLELGGNAPFIVFDDADVDVAVEGAMASKFRNAGQTCVCANRILVQAGIHDEFTAKLSAAVDRLKIGDGLAPDTTIGPLINSAAIAKVKAHLEDALGLGATLATQIKTSADELRFAQPAVLIGVTADMRLSSEETFGPIAPIMKFHHEEEAVNLANATPFGLASYFYTNDLHRAWRVGEELEFGMVGLNTGSLGMEMAPFGGIKASGLGREGGREGIEEYLEPKAFHWGGLKIST
ncbi:MAG TPA: NAD-dependent succinate-semialdehyde dehydrogenase [Rhizomicrobium sp.]|nr:NAD-dependent succinate-semialdehyde dehydrogenase [Rhizomicrobium sp.]